MWDREKEAAMMAEKRRTFLETGYSLFSSKGIESVTLQEIATASKLGIATLYRYFVNKQGLVVAIGTWKWEEYLKENAERRPNADFSGMNAAEIFEFYLDSFLELYRNHKDMLRFNQFFNVYVETEQIDPEVLKPYLEIIRGLGEHIHGIYVLAEKDHTVRIDEPEEEMFSKTLHLMLAAATRYAVGLVYIPEGGFDAEKELSFLKELILREYCS